MSKRKIKISLTAKPSDNNFFTKFTKFRVPVFP